MNIDPTTAVIVPICFTAIICSVLLPFLVKRERGSLKKIYERMHDRELVEVNIVARTMKWTIFAGACFVPLLVLLRMGLHVNYILLAVTIALGCLSTLWLSLEVEQLTTNEILIRKIDVKSCLVKNSSTKNDDEKSTK